jgi:hypothetical protein
MTKSITKWRVIASLVLAVCLLASATTTVSASSTTRITATVGQPLQCSNVRATDIGYYGATIRWETNRDAASKVYYDTVSRASIDDYRYTTENLTLVTDHSVRLTGLRSGTRYYYRVKSTATGNISCISAEYTFTTRTLPSPSGPSPTPKFHLNVIISGVSTSYEISGEGELLEIIERTSPDGKVTIVIPEGTIVLDKDGNPLLTLTIDVDPNPSCPPPQGAYVILPYNFSPSGATFAPPITLTWHYDQADIPAGVAEKDLIVAYCDKNTGQWVPVPSAVNVDTNTVTATVSHFTTFALIGAPAVQYNLTVASTTGGSATAPGQGTFTYDKGTVVNLVASPTSGYRFVKWTGNVNTITNVNAASTTITMSGNYSITANFEVIPPTGRGVNWLLIGVIIAVVVIVGLIIFFLRRRKKS